MKSRDALSIQVHRLSLVWTGMVAKRSGPLLRGMAYQSHRNKCLGIMSSSYGLGKLTTSRLQFVSELSNSCKIPRPNLCASNSLVKSGKRWRYSSDSAIANGVSRTYNGCQRANETCRAASADAVSTNSHGKPAMAAFVWTKRCDEDARSAVIFFERGLCERMTAV